MTVLLFSLVAAWSDEGGFVLDRGMTISAGAYYGADVLPARAGGVVTFTYALPRHFDLQLGLAGGLETTQNLNLDPILTLRWGFWQRERHGLVLALKVILPIDFVIADEVLASGHKTMAQAALLGVPVEASLIYGWAPFHWLELGALATARIFPATTGEVSGGGGVGLRVAFHIGQGWLVALTGIGRLESTTYPPLVLRIGPTGQLFFVPQAMLSGAFRW